MLLDHDPAVVAVASQPFWLFWPVGEGKARSHVPDYFARLADDSALVVDCRPVERIKPKDMAAFEAIRAACERARGLAVPAGRRPGPDRGGERAVACPLERFGVRTYSSDDLVELPGPPKWCWHQLRRGCHGHPGSRHCHRLDTSCRELLRRMVRMVSRRGSGAPWMRARPRVPGQVTSTFTQGLPVFWLVLLAVSAKSPDRTLAFQ
jgi:hypothetical protein